LDRNGFKRSEFEFEQTKSISVHFNPFSLAGLVIFLFVNRYNVVLNIENEPLNVRESLNKLEIKIRHVFISYLSFMCILIYIHIAHLLQWVQGNAISAIAFILSPLFIRRTNKDKMIAIVLIASP